MLYNKQRNHFIDTIRGICILLMFVDHFALFYSNLIPYNVFGHVNEPFKHLCMSYLTSDFRKFARYFVMVLFFLISGYCCKYSRNNIKRSRKLMLYCWLMSFATFLVEVFVEYNCFVICGVLFCYAFYVFLYLFISLYEFKPIHLFELVLLAFLIYMILDLLNIRLETNYLIFLGIPSKNYIAPFEYVPPIRFLWAFLFGILWSKLTGENIIKCKKNIVSYIGKYGIELYYSHFILIILMVIFVC